MFLIFLLAYQLDLNRASLNEIYTLPIDSIIAYRIYEHREIYGDFQSIFELRNIKGIDAELFEKIKPLIKIAMGLPPRAECKSIMAEQKKLASEEPPSKAAIDEWEDLIRTPMNINKTTFDKLLMIDRMTPIDASAIMQHVWIRSINTTRDLQRVKGLNHYAYSSLRKYVQFVDEPEIKKPSGSFRLKFENENRFDVGEEDDNIATRISYLENAIEEFDSTAINLKNVYEWTDQQCGALKERLLGELDILGGINPEPEINIRVKLNYQKRLRIGLNYDKKDKLYKGYAGIADLGLINRFYLGNYRVIWGEGLMIDNSDEYRARIYSRSVGIFGDLTENYSYDLFGAAGSFSFLNDGWSIQPSFFYSNTRRDALINPDNTVWRMYQNPIRFSCFKNNLNEEIYGANLNISLLEKIIPGTHISFEGMAVNYDKPFAPAAQWIDKPLDNYEPTFYPEITALSKNQNRIFYGTTFMLPIANTFISGELVRQHDTLNPAYVFLVKGRIQYEYFFVNLLFRHYDINYDNPFHRGFSEYRRFEDTPFEKPYALLDPEYTSIYDDPTPKPEQGIFLETRYQITRNIILTRAYLDIFRNLSHNLVNQRGYFELEFQPVWPVRIRYSQKYIRKYLPKPILPILSRTHESTIKVFFFLSNYDALRIETRLGVVDLTATEGDDLDLSGGYLAFSYEHNFLTSFSVEGGCALWSTDGMSQWIFEDVGIDFLIGYGMKYYIVASQKIGSILAKFKFRQKFTKIPHTGLYNNEEIHYPDLPGVRVHDFTNNENSTFISLQLDYLF